MRLVINYEARSLYLLGNRHRYLFVGRLGGSHSGMERDEGKIFSLHRELIAYSPVVQLTARPIYRLRYPAHDYRL